MISEKEIIRRLEEGAISLPPLELKLFPRDEGHGDLGVDATIQVCWGKQREEFAVELKAQFTPKALREVMYRIKAAVRDMGLNPMIIVPYLSEHALRELEGESVSGVDLCGNGIVVVPGRMFIYRTGNPNRFPSSAPIKNIYRKNTSMVGRLFLVRPRFNQVTEIMEEISMLAPIYGGMQHDRLENSWGLQWPCWDRSHPGTPFLHKYYFTRGKGRFVPAEHQPPAELPDDDYPFLLITGRIYHQYHTGTMTRRSALLSREAGEALLQLHPEDGRRLGVRSGDLVRMRSRRGEVQVKAQLTDAVKAGEVYTTFHFS